MDIVTHTEHIGDWEIRHGYIGELACPNPRERYMMTRTYEDMRKEYDLLHCGEITEEDMMRIELQMARSNADRMHAATAIAVTWMIVIAVACLVWAVRR